MSKMAVKTSKDTHKSAAELGTPYSCSTLTDYSRGAGRGTRHEQLENRAAESTESTELSLEEEVGGGRRHSGHTHAWAAGADTCNGVGLSIVCELAERRDGQSRCSG